MGLRVGAVLAVELGATAATARFGRTFGDVPAGELLAYIDARDTLALAINGGSAAEELGIGTNAELVLRTR